MAHFDGADVTPGFCGCNGSGATARFDGKRPGKRQRAAPPCSCGQTASFDGASDPALAAEKAAQRKKFLLLMGGYLALVGLAVFVLYKLR
jgi:hypothetical protein